MRIYRQRGQGLLGNSGFSRSDLTDGTSISWSTTTNKWELADHLEDAPSDGTQYGRTNGAWTAVSSGTALVNTVDNGSAAELHWGGADLKLTTYQWGVFSSDDLQIDAYSTLGTTGGSPAFRITSWPTASTWYQIYMKQNGSSFEISTYNHTATFRTRMKIDSDGYWNFYKGSDLQWMYCSSSITQFGYGSHTTNIIGTAVNLAYGTSTKLSTLTDGVSITGRMVCSGREILVKDYRAFAYGRIDGSSGTPTLSGDKNVTSITDLGVGIYRVNTSVSGGSSDSFTQYQLVANDGSTALIASGVRNSSTQFDIYLFDDTGAATDGIVNFIIYRTGGG